VSLQIKLFFKWIKQNLRIKAFYGTSENAGMTHIWITVRPRRKKPLEKSRGFLTWWRARESKEPPQSPTNNGKKANSISITVALPSCLSLARMILSHRVKWPDLMKI